MSLTLERPTMREIAADVAAKHGLTPDELRGRCQKRRYAHPRQEAYARCYAIGKTVTQIAMFFRRHHTTVLEGMDRWKARRAATSSLRDSAEAAETRA